MTDNDNETFENLEKWKQFENMEVQLPNLKLNEFLQ